MEAASETAPHVLGQATTYNEMLAAVRALLELRGLSHKQLDELAGLPEGYTGKFLGGAQVKRMGTMAMWHVFAALGARIQFVDDPMQVNRLREFYNTRKETQARSGVHAGPASIHMRKRVFAQLASLGGRAYVRKTTKRQRSERAKLMAEARWRGLRKDRKGRRRWKGSRPK